MSHFLVRGGRRLDGRLTVQGAKNSVLPILAATLLARGQVVLLGCPHLRDVDASIRILHHLGCGARWEGDALTVDTAALDRCEISDQLMREMRSSAIFLGPSWPGAARRTSATPAGASWAPGPSTCTCPACGSWGRRSGRRGASSTAGRRPWWAGRWCCGCPPWAPRRT